MCAGGEPATPSHDYPEIPASVHAGDERLDDETRDERDDTPGCGERVVEGVQRRVEEFVRPSEVRIRAQ